MKSGIAFFLIIKFPCRIPHLGSEVNFIEDLVEESYLVSEMGHMLTTLKVSRRNSSCVYISQLYLVMEKKSNEAMLVKKYFFSFIISFAFPFILFFNMPLNAHYKSLQIILI